MDGRTYRYFKGEPLYGFGYGLSYSTFQYSAPKGGPAKNGWEASVRVTNASGPEGDEVVNYTSPAHRTRPSARCAASSACICGRANRRT
jgi:hypothetical protein